ncbi:MAG: BACON domain-containing protein [Alistipes sp.]|nr:BACON domain-containing protein [Candidatus Alistipes equi]
MLHKFLTLKIFIIISSISILSFSCSKSNDSQDEPVIPTGEEIFEILGEKTFTSSWQGETQSLTFKTNVKWSLRTDSGSSWVSYSSSGATPTETKEYTVELIPRENHSAKTRSASLILSYGADPKTTHIYVNQSGMPVCTAEKVTEDMFFSTCCAYTTTAVQQGFDYDPEDDMVYFSQINNAYRVYVSWRPRVRLTKDTSKAPSHIQLDYFSHGNNISIERDKAGNKYVWIANHGTKSASDGKYRYGQVISRVKLEDGKIVKSWETTDNYYFGTHNIHASIDWDHDRFLLYSLSDEDNYSVAVYKLSDVLNAPQKTVELKYEVVRGGEAKSGDPEWKGKPMVNVHDCRALKTISKFSHRYYLNNRGWQTVYLYGDKIYFFLLYSTPQNGRSYQTVLDVLDLNGNVIKSGIDMPFSDDIEGLAKYGYATNKDMYLENEVFLIKNGVLYLSFSTQGNADEIRRPLVFNFAADWLDVGM